MSRPNLQGRLRRLQKRFRRTRTGGGGGRGSCSISDRVPSVALSSQSGRRRRSSGSYTTTACWWSASRTGTGLGFTAPTRSSSPAVSNIQTTIITRISAYGVKHTQVKSTLSPNEAGNNVSISGWIWSTKEARFTWWSIHFLWTMWKKSPRGKYVPRK